MFDFSSHRETTSSRPRRRNCSEGDQISLIDSLLKERNSSKGRPIPRKHRGSSTSMNSYEIDSETDFPCLGSSLESKVGTSSFGGLEFPLDVNGDCCVQSGSLEDTTFGEVMQNAKVGTTKKKKKFLGVAKATLKEVRKMLKNLNS